MSLLKIIDKVAPSFTESAAKILHKGEIDFATSGNLAYDGLEEKDEWGDGQLIFYSHPVHGEFNHTSDTYEEVTSEARALAVQQVIEANLIDLSENDDGETPSEKAWYDALDRRAEDPGRHDRFWNSDRRNDGGPDQSL